MGGFFRHQSRRIGPFVYWFSSKRTLARPSGLLLQRWTSYRSWWYREHPSKVLAWILVRFTYWEEHCGRCWRTMDELGSLQRHLEYRFCPWNLSSNICLWNLCNLRSWRYRASWHLGRKLVLSWWARTFCCCSRYQCRMVGSRQSSHKSKYRGPTSQLGRYVLSPQEFQERDTLEYHRTIEPSRFTQGSWRDRNQ